MLASFYFLRVGRLRPTLAWVAVALLCREDVVVVVVAMALYSLTLRRPGRLRFALVLAAAAGVSAMVTWGVLRPSFTHGEADYARVYSRWGATVSQALMAMLQDPLRALFSLVATPNDADSRRIRLTDSDPLNKPRIHGNDLAAEQAAHSTNVDDDSRRAVEIKQIELSCAVRVDVNAKNAAARAGANRANYGRRPRC